MLDIQCVAATRDSFGESPLWSATDQALYWVDVTKPAMRRYQPATGALETWAIAEDIGSIGHARAGTFVAGMRSGFYIVDPKNNQRRLLAALATDDRRLRLNDGKCDRAGRFWSGTLDDQDFSPIGTLYRLDADHRCTALDDGFVLINGIAWSPDDKYMYVADFRARWSIATSSISLVAASSTDSLSSRPRTCQGGSTVPPSPRTEAIGAPMSAEGRSPNTIHTAS